MDSTELIAGRWLKLQEVEQLLIESGMPGSRSSIERLLEDAGSGFPPPRQRKVGATRLWDRQLIEEYIVRSRCIAPAAGSGVAA